MVRTPPKRLKSSKPSRKSPPLTRDQIAEEFKTMQSNSKWDLTDFENIFTAVRKDSDAWCAFETIVGCGYQQDHLLMSLGITFKGNPDSQFANGNHWNAWDNWDDKWEGLEGVAETLSLVATKMEAHVSKSDRGPIPLPTLSGTEEGSTGYRRSNASEKHLAEIHRSISAMAEELRQYCEMRRIWRKAVPRNDIIEDESLGLFMRSIKARTDEWHVPEVVMLLKAGNINITPETLWKMLKLRTPLLDRSDPRTGYQWKPDIRKL